MQPGTARKLEAIINAALRGRLDKALAQKLHEFGPEAVTLAMLAMSRHIAEQDAALAKCEGQDRHGV